MADKKFKLGLIEEEEEDLQPTHKPKPAPFQTEISLEEYDLTIKKIIITSPTPEPEEELESECIDDSDDKEDISEGSISEESIFEETFSEVTISEVTSSEETGDCICNERESLADSASHTASNFTASEGDSTEVPLKSPTTTQSSTSLSLASGTYSAASEGDTNDALVASSPPLIAESPMPFTLLASRPPTVIRPSVLGPHVSEERSTASAGGFTRASLASKRPTIPKSKLTYYAESSL